MTYAKIGKNTKGAKKTILLTGGTGFLGSRILELLVSQNYPVVLIKRSSSDSRRINHLLRNKTIDLFDIDKYSAEDCFNNYKIDSIIHTATCYGRLNESVFDIIKSNFVLPVELLMLALRRGVSCFINTDTFSNEKIELTGNEKFYVRSKKDFLKYAKDLINGADMVFANMIIEQMYGPDDNKTKFIPFIVKSLLGNVKEISLTPGKQRRDFVFVDDCAEAIMSVLNNKNSLSCFEEFGIGTGQAVAIKKVVEVIKDKTNSNTVLKWGDLPYRKNEIMSHRANISNNKKIKWKPAHALEEGINKTVEFYKKLNS